MTLRTRRILYVSFIILFFVITPLLCLYAAGYKIDFEQKTIQKTGMLVLDSNPRGARIYINNKPQYYFFKKYYSYFTNKDNYVYIVTPAKIKNLLPGEYKVKLKLNGYWPWEKKLKIFPGSSTFAEDINLFKNNLPLILFDRQIDMLSISPNKKHLVAIASNTVSIINLDSNKIISTTTSKQTPRLFWSHDGKKFIFGEFVFDDNLKLSNSLTQIFDDNIKHLQWDYKNNNVIYYQKQDVINKFNILSQENKIVFKQKGLIDYLIKDEKFFLVNRQNKTTVLEIRSLEGMVLKSIKLPLSNYTFINPKSNFINVYDKKYHILYLIDPKSFFNPLYETINSVYLSQWIDNNKLLYATEFELWIFDCSKHKKTLLTRISQPINNIAWHPSNNYVFYSTKNTIYNIELDDREKRNITQIIKLNKLKKMYLSEDGKDIYFYAQIGHQKGVYKLNIQ